MVGEIAFAVSLEEHIEPERWSDEGALDNGVVVYEQQTPRYSTAPKYPNQIGVTRDYYARCPACGWTAHLPDLPRIRRAGHEHPCVAALAGEDEKPPDPQREGDYL